MDIKNKGTFIGIVQRAYQSSNPIDLLYKYVAKNINKSFVLNKWAKNIQDSDVVTTPQHPCYGLLSDVSLFEASHTDSEIYCRSSFFGLLTRSVTICDKFVFAFVKPNIPIGVVSLDISEDGDKLTMLSHTLKRSREKFFRVQFNGDRLYFSLDDMMQASTVKECHFIIDGKRNKLTGFIPGYDCVLVVKRGDTIGVYWNDHEDEKIWQCPYFVFSSSP